MTKFIVIQDGMQVAGSEGEMEQAFSEAIHYAEQYAKDGDVEIYACQGRKKVRILTMSFEAKTD